MHRPTNKMKFFLTFIMVVFATKTTSTSNFSSAEFENDLNKIFGWDLSKYFADDFKGTFNFILKNGSIKASNAVLNKKETIRELRTFRKIFYYKFAAKNVDEIFEQEFLNTISGRIGRSKKDNPKMEMWMYCIFTDFLKFQTCTFELILIFELDQINQ